MTAVVTIHAYLNFRRKKNRTCNATEPYPWFGFTLSNDELQLHGDEPYRILVVQNRILFVISGFYLCKRVFVGRGKYPENHM